MSSSSRNVVPPVPQRKGRSISSSSSVHQLTSLPSYSAPVCEASSITKLEIIEALSGKSGTKGGALSCSKDTLKTVLLPILQYQGDFYKLLGKIDNENVSHSSSSSSTASSLKATFVIEFPADESDENHIVFYTSKSAIAHKEKKELAVKIVNLYKLFELDKSSKYFRTIEKNVKQLERLVVQAIEHVKIEKEVKAEPKLLRGGEKSTPVQMERKYCQGGGFKPKDGFYQVCVFCKHPFVVPPSVSYFEDMMSSKYDIFFFY